MANTAETGTHAANKVLVEDPSVISQKNSTSSSHPAANSYACSLCSKRFRLPADLNRHVRDAHTRPKVWGCAAFTNHDLAFTTNDSHQSGVTTCVFCGEIFSAVVTPELRLNHLLHAHLFGACDLERQFYRVDKLQQHPKHYHGVRLPRWTQTWRDALLLQSSNNRAGEGGHSSGMIGRSR